MATLLRLLAVLAVIAAADAFLRRPRRLRNTKPQFWMSSVELARWLGYTLDTHTFVTSDGYELVLHHVVASKNGTRGGLPVVFGHGLASSDEQWYFRPDGLVPMMVEHGYDLWTFNYRGSFYSRKHETLTTRDHDFWDFSWHENGVVDHAESIDYVLNKTGHEKVIAIGHSLSVTALEVLLATRPEYNDKIMGQVLLSPQVLTKHATGFVAYVSHMLKLIPGGELGFSANVENDLFPGFDKPFPQACFPYDVPKPKIRPFCRRLIEFIMGNFHEPVDEENLQLIMHHFPAGTSIRQMQHYAQCINSGRFAQYDYGKDRNQDLYGQDLPPEYNLTNIRTPTYIVYAVGDGSVNWKDSEAFAKALQPGVLQKLHRLPPKVFCHIDFVIAYDAVELVYKPVISYVDEIKEKWAKQD
ncbi:lipase 1-like [Thrips palmi]|uniref:Lipase n=1 Tax=Thrips palmi TaxID=161013 RepID=A0A6P8ZWX5_THRPL|nr:lipase 1-like [Thrips palmi]